MQIRLDPTLVVFKRARKTWLFSQILGWVCVWVFLMAVFLLAYFFFGMIVFISCYPKRYGGGFYTSQQIYCVSSQYCFNRTGWIYCMGKAGCFHKQKTPWCFFFSGSWWHRSLLPILLRPPWQKVHCDNTIQASSSHNFTEVLQGSMQRREFASPCCDCILQTSMFLHSPLPIEPSFASGGPQARKIYPTLFTQLILAPALTSIWRTRKWPNQADRRSALIPNWKTGRWEKES